MIVRSLLAFASALAVMGGFPTLPVQERQPEPQVTGRNKRYRKESEKERRTRQARRAKGGES